MRGLLLVMLFFINYAAIAQLTDSTRTDSLQNRRVQTEGQRQQQAVDDSTKTAYVNPGKVAARKSVIRSAIIPGWGQLTNYRTLLQRKDDMGQPNARFWEKGLIIIKTAAVYAGAGLVTWNLIDNNKQYKTFKNEVLYRNSHDGQSAEGSPYASVTTTQLIEARDNYSRNIQILYFSYGVIYVANLVDTYVTARLNFFDVGDSRRVLRLKPGIEKNDNLLAIGGAKVLPGLSLKLIL